MRSMRLAAVISAAVTCGIVAWPGPAGAQPTGATWRVYKSIAVRNTSLDGIVALADGTAWAGGKAAGKPLIYRFSGNRWHQVQVPGLAGTGVVAIGATSAANVWVTLRNADSAAHLTASGWRTTSFGPTLVNSVGAVVTTGPRNSWVFTTDLAGTSGLAHHFNGSSWSTVHLPAAPVSAMTGASASSARNVWTWAYDSSTRRYVTLRYDGTRWRLFGVPAKLAPAGQSVSPQAMLAVSPDDVWATAYTSSLGTAGPVILLHWQGQAWSKVTGTLPAGALKGPMARDGAGGLWLSAVTPASSPVILHYRGGRWTTFGVPSDPAGIITLRGLSLIPGTRAAWGAGVTGQTALGSTTGAVILRLG